ncbi:MAG: hypothetical protein OXF68_00710 [Gammaproteobacteria bacterium]|nr:hypothetical protein [Gammaproteobacteria bacterium]
MADRLRPLPKREDKVMTSRLDTTHSERWKNVQSHLKGASSCSIPSKRGTPLKPNGPVGKRKLGLLKGEINVPDQVLFEPDEEIEKMFYGDDCALKPTSASADGIIGAPDSKLPPASR